MEDQLITFPTAKLAKEKEFNIPVYFQYNINGEAFQVFDFVKGENVNSKSRFFSAPTQSLLQRWLREKHKIHIEINIGLQLGTLPIAEVFYPFILNLNKIKHSKGGKYKLPKPISIWPEKDVFFEKYEDALEISLQEVLKLI